MRSPCGGFFFCGNYVFNGVFLRMLFSFQRPWTPISYSRKSLKRTIIRSSFEDQTRLSNRLWRPHKGAVFLFITTRALGKLFEGNIENGTILPTSVIKMPPFIGVSVEAKCIHDFPQDNLVFFRLSILRHC